MKSQIAKSFKFNPQQCTLKEGPVWKKSKWVKAWRKRHMVLLSSKIIFYEEEQKKPKENNVLYMSDILCIQGFSRTSCQIKITAARSNYQIKFDDAGEKMSWLEDILQAYRTYKINNARLSQSRKCSSESSCPKCPNTAFCVKFQCF